MPDPSPSPREQLEQRLTALLLGELSETEAAELHAAMAGDPDLQQLHDQLEKTIGLVREVATSPEIAETAPSSEPAQLSPDRRASLLQSFKVISPEELARRQRRRVARRELLLVAAMFVGLLAVVGVLTTVVAIKPRAMNLARESFADGLAKEAGRNVELHFRERALAELRDEGFASASRRSTRENAASVSGLGFNNSEFVPNQPADRPQSATSHNVQLALPIKLDDTMYIAQQGPVMATSGNTLWDTGTDAIKPPVLGDGEETRQVAGKDVSKLGRSLDGSAQVEAKPNADLKTARDAASENKQSLAESSPKPPSDVDLAINGAYRGAAMAGETKRRALVDQIETAWEEPQRLSSPTPTSAASDKKSNTSDEPRVAAGSVVNEFNYNPAEMATKDAPKESQQKTQWYSIDTLKSGDPENKLYEFNLGTSRAGGFGSAGGAARANPGQFGFGANTQNIPPTTPEFSDAVSPATRMRVVTQSQGVDLVGVDPKETADAEAKKQLGDLPTQLGGLPSMPGYHLPNVNASSGLPAPSEQPRPESFSKRMAQLVEKAAPAPKASVSSPSQSSSPVISAGAFVANGSQDLKANDGWAMRDGRADSARGEDAGRTFGGAQPSSLEHGLTSGDTGGPAANSYFRANEVLTTKSDPNRGLAPAAGPLAPTQTTPVPAAVVPPAGVPPPPPVLTVAPSEQAAERSKRASVDMATAVDFSNAPHPEKVPELAPTAPAAGETKLESERFAVAEKPKRDLSRVELYNTVTDKKDVSEFETGPQVISGLPAMHHVGTGKTNAFFDQDSKSAFQSVTVGNADRNAINLGGFHSPSPADPAHGNAFPALRGMVTNGHYLNAWPSGGDGSPRVVDDDQLGRSPAPDASLSLWGTIRSAFGNRRPEASARVTLQKEPEIAGLGVVQGRAGDATSNFDPHGVQTESEKIQSKDVLNQVIDRLNLNEAWGERFGGGQALQSQQSYEKLRKMIDVRPDKNSAEVDIRVKGATPQESAAIANTVAKVYEERRQQRVEELAKLERSSPRILAEQEALKDLAGDQTTEELKRKVINTETDGDGPAGPIRHPAPNAPIPQPEIITADNPYSTFSLNVSDVSFKLAAASLEKGQMPDPGSVRTEEFINAFDYHDPEPIGNQRLAFHWERARYPFAHNRDLIRLSVKTAAIGRQPGRPLNLVLLLDNSGSMERADRLRIRRECLRVLASQLQPADRISVVSFARTARLWIDGLSGTQAGELVSRVGNLSPEGGTNLEEAMKLAYQTARRHFQATGINRVVLLTDGAANLGEVDPATLKKQVENNRQQGIALDCFGIGWDGYNDDLLETLSHNGDGRYGFINTQAAASTEFAGQLAGALRVAAADVKVQVQFNPARVTAYRQMGYATHQLKKEQFRDNTVDAAEIGAAEAGNALYVVEVNPRGDGPLGVARVRYKIPGTQEFREQEWTLAYDGASKRFDQAAASLRLAGVAAAFSEWLVATPFAADVTPNKLIGYLGDAVSANANPSDPRPKQLEAMLRQAGSLTGNK